MCYSNAFRKPYGSRKYEFCNVPARLSYINFIHTYYTLRNKTQVWIIIFIYCNCVVTRWQWLFYMYTKHEIGYYYI